MVFSEGVNWSLRVPCLGWLAWEYTYPVTASPKLFLQKCCDHTERWKRKKSCNERDKLKVNASTGNTLEFLPEGHSTWELSIKSTPVAFSTIGVFDLVLSGRFAISDMSLSDVARLML